MTTFTWQVGSGAFGGAANWLPAGGPPGTNDPALVLVSGNATIWSYVVPHPPLLPAYAELAPYNVIVVSLDEDPTIRMVGNLLGRPDGPINEVDPSTIRIGEPVRVVFQPVDDVTLPRWVRAPG